MGRLTGKVAVVTGGVSGIALGIVDMYVAEGAKVVVADIQAEKGARLESRYPGTLCFNHCDIREEDDIARTMAMAEERFGGLDIVVHAAASVDHKQKIADLTTEAWDDGQANLLRSHVMCIKHAIGPMERRGGGSVVLVSSAAAENFSAAASMVYVVCKGAVLYLARWAAFELAASKIRVNAIIPGSYATSIWGPAGRREQGGCRRHAHAYGCTDVRMAAAAQGRKADGHRLCGDLSRLRRIGLCHWNATGGRWGPFGVPAFDAQGEASGPS